VRNRTKNSFHVAPPPTLLSIFHRPTSGDALPTVLSFTREKQEARAESFLNSILLSPGFVYPGLSLFLSLTLYSISSVSSRFLSRINIPTTGLSTSTVYLLLAIRLGTSPHMPDLRGIGRKAHLPRSIIPFSPSVNSRIRLDDVDEIFACTVHTIERNYAQKSCDTCTTSRGDSTFKCEKSYGSESIERYSVELQLLYTYN